MAGPVPVRASHSIRQESSPTLQNSCALHDKQKFTEKHQESFALKKEAVSRSYLDGQNATSSTVSSWP